MTVEIDLVFFEGCPHVDAAREALGQGLALVGRHQAWREWRSDDPALPPFAAGFGSPSIFIGRREVTGASPGGSASACRIFRDGDGAPQPAPTPVEIARALREAGS